MDHHCKQIHNYLIELFCWQISKCIHFISFQCIQHSKNLLFWIIYVMNDFLNNLYNFKLANICTGIPSIWKEMQLLSWQKKNILWYFVKIGNIYFVTMINHNYIFVVYWSWLIYFIASTIMNWQKNILELMEQKINTKDFNLIYD